MSILIVAGIVVAAIVAFYALMFIGGMVVGFVQVVEKAVAEATKQ